MGMPKKEYYRLSELAADWQCAVEDIHHHFLHNRIRIGVRAHNELLYGLNADLQTVGIYWVSGILTIPKSNADDWEFDAKGLTEAGGLLVELDYPPEIVEASDLSESSVSIPFFGWAPDCDWKHPETDHSRIERFVIGVHGIDENGDPIFDWRTIDPSKLVVHAVERERFEREYVLTAAKAQDAEPPLKTIPSSSTAKPNAVDTTSMVAWQAAVLESWDKITALHGSKPAARSVLAWLRKNGPPDVFWPDSQTRDRNSVVWVDPNDVSHTLLLKTLGNRLSEWRNEGKIPS